MLFMIDEDQELTPKMRQLASQNNLIENNPIKGFLNYLAAND